MGKHSLAGESATTYARYVGRVGALAVALGVGAAVATGFGTGVAQAEDTSGSGDTSSTDTSTDTAGPQPPNPDGDVVEQSPPAGSAESDAQAADDTSAETGMNVDSSGGIDDSVNDDGQSTDSDGTTPSDDGADETEEKGERTPEAGSTPEPAPAQRGSGTMARPNVSSKRTVAVQTADSGAGTNRKSNSIDTTDSIDVTRMGVTDTPSSISRAQTSEFTTLSQTSAVQAETAAVGLPRAVVGFATTVVGVLLSPFLSTGPSAPAEPPLLWAVLAFVRREITRTFFNGTPDAVADQVTTSEDTSKTFDVLGNDADRDEDELAVTSVTQPTNGAVVINANGTLTYTPKVNFAGTDTFTYIVSDVGSPFHLHGFFGFFGRGHSDTAQVTVTVTPVNDAPVAVNDTATTNEDTALSIAVLANDTDAENNTLTPSLVTGPTNGSLTLNANKTYTYTPAAGYSGPDSFTYKVNDGITDSNTATVAITVTAVNDAPVAADDSATTTSGTPVDIAVLANDTDAENNTLTPSLVTGPTNGSLTLNADKTYTYTPAAGYTGPDSFTYKVNDGITDSNTATVSIVVNSVPADNGLLANHDSYTVINPGGLAPTPELGVLANDTDPDGGALPEGATAELLDEPLNDAQFQFNSDGSFAYTPVAGYTGTDRFTYRIRTGTTVSAPATVIINVEPAPPNGAPVFSQSVTDSVDRSTGVVRGHVVFTDPENDDLTYRLEGVPAETVGLVDLNAETGHWVFTPTPQARLDAYDGLPNLAMASFTVVASDGEAETTGTALARIDATNAVEIPLAEQQFAYGPPVVRSDGTSYKTSSVLLEPGTENYRTTITIISPTRTTPTIIGFDGAPMGDVVFGPDGTAYQAIQQGHRYASDVTTTVLVISPDASTYTSHVTPGQASYGPIVGPDNTVYQISDNNRPGPSVNTTWVAAFSGPGAPVVVSVDGAPDVGFAQDPLAFGPNGEVYLTTTIEDVVNGLDSTQVTKLNADGSTTPIRALDGAPFGSVVFAPDGTAYQLTKVFGAPEPVVVTNVDTGAVLVTATGEVSSPVTFGPNGTAHFTTATPDPDTDDIIYSLHVVEGTASHTILSIRGRSTGDVQFGTDGTAYQYIAAVDPDTLENETLVVVMPPGDPGNRILEEFPGQPVRMVVGPDGDVYQIVHTDSTEGDEFDRTYVWRVSPGLERAAFPFGGFAGIAFAPDGTGYLTTTRILHDNSIETEVTVFDSDGTELDSFEFTGSADDAPVVAADGAVWQTIATTDPITGGATTTVAIISPTGDTTTIVFAGEPLGPLTVGPDGLAYQTTGFTDPFTGTIGNTSVWIMDTSAADVKPDTAPVVVGPPIVNASDAETGVVTGFLNVVDADGDALTYRVTEVNNGALSIDSTTGAFIYTPYQADRLVFAGETDSFRVSVTDGVSPAVEVGVSVTIAPAELTVSDPIDVGDAALGLEVSPDGDRVYVRGLGGIVVFDTTTDTPSIITTIPATSSADIEISSDSSRVYVASSDGTVLVIDGGAPVPVVIDTIDVGAPLQGLALNPDGTRLYAASDTGASITVVNIVDDANVVVGDPIAANSPSDMIISADGARLYVGTYDSATTTSRISVFDLTSPTASVITDIEIPNPAEEFAISRDGSRLYVTTTQGDVLAFRTAPTSLTIFDNVANGDFVDGLALSPDGSVLYVPHYNQGMFVYASAGFGIDMIDIRGRSDVAVSGDGTRIYVTGDESRSLTVIRFGPPAPEEPEIPPV